MFSNRKIIILAAALASTAFAERPQTDDIKSEYGTKTIFLGALTTGFVGAVATADACQTIYDLTCTDTSVCPTPFTLTATAAPSAYEFQFSTATSIIRVGSVGASVSQSCTMISASPPVASCSMWQRLSGPGYSSVQATSTTYSGDEVVFAQVPITAGFEQLAKSTGACTAASATPSGRIVVAQEGGAGRVVREVVKVVVVGAGVVGLVM